MKFYPIFSILALCATFLFTACGNDGDAARDAAVDNAAGQAAPAPSVTPNDAAPAATPEPAQNAAGVWHYTCPNGCEGGAGAAGPCPKCGATLAHNQAYHANAAQPSAVPTPSGDANLTPVPKPTQEPAQNAAGVWHYTCPNGCEGGGAAAGPCPKCGATLAHNTAYHQ